MKNLVLIVVVFSCFWDGLAQKAIVNISAKIENRHGDYIYINTNKKNPKKIKIDRFGYFIDTLAVYEGFYQMYDGGKNYADLYLSCDYNLTITADASNFEKSLAFSGNGANENNYLATQRAKEVNYDYKDLMNMKEPEFKFAIDKRIISDLRRLDKGDLDVYFAQVQTEKLGAMVKRLKDYYAKLHGEDKDVGVKDLNYSYQNYGGDMVGLSDFEGRFVFVQVWTTTSGPSESEAQYLREIIRKYEPKGITFVNIAIDPIADFEKWKTFVDEKGLTGVQLLADAGWQSKIVTDFKITSVPRYILIGKDGKLMQPDAPRPSSPNLRAGFEKLLSEDFEKEEKQAKEDEKQLKTTKSED